MLLRWQRLEGLSGHDAGRQLLSEMYKEHTGQEMPEILAEGRGKPYFATGNLHFSISHTKDHVFCILADVPVGIDAEETSRRVDLRLADKILSSAERLRYDAEPDKTQALLKFWVLKEAAAKCSGEGLRGYPNQTDFSLDDPRITEIDGCFVAVIRREDHAV